MSDAALAVKMLRERLRPELFRKLEDLDVMRAIDADDLKERVRRGLTGEEIVELSIALQHSIGGLIPADFDRLKLL